MISDFQGRTKIDQEEEILSYRSVTPRARDRLFSSLASREFPRHPWTTLDHHMDLKSEDYESIPAAEIPRSAKRIRELKKRT